MGEPDQRNPPSRACTSSLRARAVTAAGLALLAAWSLRPFLVQLRFWPLTIDGVWWVSEYTVFRPDWARAVFASAHGTGYRPVAALSYLLDHAIGGFSPLVYRATDLGLHALGGFLVFALLRRLAPQLPRWGALVAAGIFLSHPAVEAVVPILDARSYMLATVFGLGSLVALRSALEGGRSRAAMLAGSGAAALLLGCALLSNETAFATVGIFPFVAFYAAWPGSQRWRAAARAAVAPLALAAAVFVARALVVEGMGGYQSRRLDASWFLPIWEASWRSAGALPLERPIEPQPVSTAAAIGLGLAAAYYLWRVLAEMIRARGGGGGSALPALLALWALGYSVMCAGLGVWFKRLAYPMLAPLSMLLGLVLAQTVRRYRARWLLLVAHLVPQLFLLGYVLHRSPAIVGLHPDRVARRTAVNQLINDMYRDLGRVSEPATVRLVIPYQPEPPIRRFRERPVAVTPGLPRNHAVSGYLMKALLHDRDVVVEPFLFFETPSLQEPGSLRFARAGGRPALRIPRDQTFYVLDSGQALRKRSREESWVWLDESPLASDRNHYVYVASAGSGRLDAIRRVEPR